VILILVSDQMGTVSTKMSFVIKRICMELALSVWIFIITLRNYSNVLRRLQDAITTIKTNVFLAKLLSPTSLEDVLLKDALTSIKMAATNANILSL
jgi:hypothetical protein